MLLVTNSDWTYAQAMMRYSFDRFPPQGAAGWRSLFDLVIVEARKPSFFLGRQAVYRLADEARGLFLPQRGPLQQGEVYVGGDAHLVEASLELSGAHIPYAGDYLFGDVHVSKEMLRWRTGLVLRQIEPEILGIVEARDSDRKLEELMARKAELESRIAAALDASIAPLARQVGEIGSPNWGPLMLAGSDKSLFTRQVERYADVYTSRVSNLLHVTPFAYLRAARGSLPHDPA